MDEQVCKCGNPIDVGWPGNDNDTICQDCWESECDKSWWEMVRTLANVLAVLDEAVKVPDA